MPRGKPVRWKAGPARRAAEIAGRRTYYGEPCFNGHDGVRYTRTQRCVMCTDAEATVRRVAKKARVAELAAEVPEPRGMTEPFIRPPTRAQLMGRR